ncbi:hypothetical protein [Marinobacter salicampi]|uniref:hypothetical protein n=1 Tax=Marinobacter salicampi TaxID=435907 RepID=UPI00140B13A5|nr:hypothetical protein [Marinobacter salicampi]
MFKKNVLLALCSSVALAACGGGGSDSSSDKSDGPLYEDETPTTTGYTDGQLITASEALRARVDECIDTSNVGFRSTHFEVFSIDDASTNEDLKAAATVAEAGLKSIQEMLVVHDDEIVGTQGKELISVCLRTEDPNNSFTGHSGTGFKDGLVINAPRAGDFSLDLENSTSQLLRHELVHVIQIRIVYGLEAGTHGGFDTDKWYSEGLAQLIAGQEVSTNATEIDAYLAAITAGTETAAPAIRTHQDHVDSNGRYRDYALAVHYLFTPSKYGANNPLSDGAELWRKLGEEIDFGATDPFASAFSKVFVNDRQKLTPLTQQQYSTNFVSWMTEFRTDAWADGNVTGTNAQNVDMVFVMEEGVELLAGRMKADGDVSSQNFEVLLTRLDPSKAYDVYFLDVVSESGGTMEVEYYGPLKGYASYEAHALQANGPGGGTTFDITNAKVTKATVED